MKMKPALVNSGLLVLSLIVFSGCTTTSNNEAIADVPEGAEKNTQSTSAVVSHDPNRMDCRSIRSTGSRIAKRTCKTSAEWDALRQEAQEAAEVARQTRVDPPVGQ